MWGRSAGDEFSQLWVCLDSHLLLKPVSPGAGFQVGRAALPSSLHCVRRGLRQSPLCPLNVTSFSLAYLKVFLLITGSEQLCYYAVPCVFVLGASLNFLDQQS